MNTDLSQILNFADSHPFLSFFVICIICITISEVVSIPFKIVNRIIRGMNIRKNGWPPVHCDADGDFKTDDR